MLSATILLLLFASAFIVICCDPELRDAEPVAGKKRAEAGERPGEWFMGAALAAFG
jgi:hypothetical protein